MRLKVKHLIFTNLATTTALTPVENKTPSVSNFVKETDYNIISNEIRNEITDHDHDKYITTPEFNKLTPENFAARLKQANLATKTDIAKFITKIDFVDSTSTKRLTEDLINKFSILNGAKYFSLGIFQGYLVFIPTKKYIKYFSGTTQIES